MASTLKDLMADVSPERRKKIGEMAQRFIRQEMSLQQLRKARKQSQVRLGRKLGVKQCTISKLERRADMYLSTLRHYIETMGGKLELIAQFPDHEPVKLVQFEQIDPKSKLADLFLEQDDPLVQSPGTGIVKKSSKSKNLVPTEINHPMH